MAGVGADVIASSTLIIICREAYLVVHLILPWKSYDFVRLHVRALSMLSNIPDLHPI